VTVKEAQEGNVCRVCGEPVIAGPAPRGWKTKFRAVQWPEPVVLNYGKEFAHRRCLEAQAAGNPVPPQAGAAR